MKLNQDNEHNVKYLAMLPLWKCHKVVQAGKISFMARDEPNQLLMIHAEPSNMPFAVPLDFLYRHNPTIGGYFVVYEDGYISYSPAEAFEAGYHEVPPLGTASGGTPAQEPKIEPSSPPDRSVIFTFTMQGIGDDRFEPKVLVAMEDYVKERRIYNGNERYSNPFLASNGVAVKWFNNDIDADNDLPNSDWGRGESAGAALGVNLQGLDALETDMPPHQLRVLQELADLSLKLQALNVFIYDEASAFASLSEANKTLLRAQAGHMSAYQEVLMARVVIF